MTLDEKLCTIPAPIANAIQDVIDLAGTSDACWDVLHEAGKLIDRERCRADEMRRLRDEESSDVAHLQAEIAELRAQIAVATEKIPPYYRLESLEKSIEFLAARHVNWIGQSGKLMDAVTKLSGENGELREALRPFAEAFERVKRGNIDFTLQDFYDENTITPDGVNCGDYRRAWLAIGGTIEKGLPE